MEFEGCYYVFTVHLKVCKYEALSVLSEDNKISHRILKHKPIQTLKEILAQAKFGNFHQNNFQLHLKNFFCAIL